jgi:ubiquinone/menaquinone biosynthesis C-methylase UbiE
MSTSAAAGYFGAMTDEYDSLVYRVVPQYAEMLDRLLEHMPPRAARVLELGSGTGNLSLKLRRRYPDAELTFVDAAPEMLAATRARVEGVGPGSPRASRFVVSRFESLELDPGYYDVIVASLSLHHVEDKLPVYRALASGLSPGGRLGVADHVRAASPAHHEMDRARWLDFCRVSGGCCAAEVQRLVEHTREHDHYASLCEHFAMLAEAGFREVDCVWRSGISGVVTALR